MGMGAPVYSKGSAVGFEVQRAAFCWHNIVQRVKHRATLQYHQANSTQQAGLAQKQSTSAPTLLKNKMGNQKGLEKNHK